MGLCGSKQDDAAQPAALRRRENTHQYGLDEVIDNPNRTVTMTERLKAPVTQKIQKFYNIGERNGNYMCVLYPGFNYFGRKACQDAYVAAHINCYGPNKTLSGPEFQLFAVFDGHGTYGDKVSAYLVQKLPVMIQQNITESGKDHIYKAFDKTFRSLHKGLQDSKEIDVSLSGSTGTCVLVTENEVHCGWAGDSKATLISVMPDGKIVATDLTKAHNFNVKAERRRAEKTGAVVRQSINEFGQSVGPYRVFLAKKNGPGLAVSRSLGDLYAHQGGCIPVPECTTIPLKPEHKFIILASDGVWDQMSSEDSAFMVWGDKTEDSVEKMVLRCAQRWIDGNQGLTDDISAVVIFLDTEWAKEAGVNMPAPKPAPAQEKEEEKKGQEQQKEEMEQEQENEKEKEEKEQQQEEEENEQGDEKGEKGEEEAKE